MKIKIKAILKKKKPPPQKTLTNTTYKFTIKKHTNKKVCGFN